MSYFICKYKYIINKYLDIILCILIFLCIYIISDYLDIIRVYFDIICLILYFVYVLLYEY